MNPLIIPTIFTFIEEIKGKVSDNYHKDSSRIASNILIPNYNILLSNKQNGISDTNSLYLVKGLTIPEHCKDTVVIRIPEETRQYNNDFLEFPKDIINFILHLASDTPRDYINISLVCKLFYKFCNERKEEKMDQFIKTYDCKTDINGREASFGILPNGKLHGKFIHRSKPGFSLGEKLAEGVFYNGRKRGWFTSIGSFLANDASSVVLVENEYYDDNGYIQRYIANNKITFDFYYQENKTFSIWTSIKGCKIVYKCKNPLPLKVYNRKGNLIGSYLSPENYNIYRANGLIKKSCVVDNDTKFIHFYTYDAKGKQKNVKKISPHLVRMNMPRHAYLLKNQEQ